MKKKVGIIKQVTCLGLIFLLSINSFAAIVSDNDGSAFITKAEFDALKASFQSQIDSYNQSIDSKIDGAIASYLAGIRISKDAENITTICDLWKTSPTSDGSLNLIGVDNFAFMEKTSGSIWELCGNLHRAMSPTLQIDYNLHLHPGAGFDAHPDLAPFDPTGSLMLWVRGNIKSMPTGKVGVGGCPAIVGDGNGYVDHWCNGSFEYRRMYNSAYVHTTTNALGSMIADQNTQPILKIELTGNNYSWISGDYSGMNFTFSSNLYYLRYAKYDSNYVEVPLEVNGVTLKPAYAVPGYSTTYPTASNNSYRALWAANEDFEYRYGKNHMWFIPLSKLKDETVFFADGKWGDQNAMTTFTLPEQKIGLNSEYIEWQNYRVNIARPALFANAVGLPIKERISVSDFEDDANIPMGFTIFGTVPKFKDSSYKPISSLKLALPRTVFGEDVLLGDGPLLCKPYTQAGTIKWRAIFTADKYNTVSGSQSAKSATRKTPGDFVLGFKNGSFEDTIVTDNGTGNPYTITYKNLKTVKYKKTSDSVWQTGTQINIEKNVEYDFEIETDKNEKIYFNVTDCLLPYEQDIKVTQPAGFQPTFQPVD